MREVRLNAGKAARFHATRGRLAGSIACDLHEERFVVVEDAQGAILTQNHSESGECRFRSARILRF